MLVSITQQVEIEVSELILAMEPPEQEIEMQD